MRPWITVALVAVAVSAGASANSSSYSEGKKAFVEVVSVLQSPRCMNCHPAGDAPLQTDRSRPHAMNVTRASAESGLPCATCHRDRNAEVIGVAAGPPGAPSWDLPPKEMPMVFEKMTPTALCEQLKDPTRNGHKDLTALLEHVDRDPLVLWAWSPGGKRTQPPMSHADFVAAFKTWIGSGAVCP